MAFQINGVEVFSNEAILSKTAITQQRDGEASEVTLDDQVLLYDDATDNMMKVSVQELFKDITVDTITTPGTGGVKIGFNAGRDFDVENFSVAVGTQAGLQASGSSRNVYVGFNAGSDHQGDDSVFLGTSAGEEALLSSDNTYVGSSAGRRVTGDRNTMVGRLTSANPSVENKDSVEDVFMGYAAGYGALDSERNTFVGAFSALAFNIGGKNTFLGHSAGRNSTDVSDNTLIGSQSGEVNVSGSNNTALGESSLHDNISGSTNLSLGYFSGFGCVSGQSNIFIGDAAGGPAVAGSDFYGNANTIIGYLHESPFPTGSNQTMSIGYEKNSWISGTINGNQAFTFLPTTQINGGLNVSDIIRSPQTEGNQIVTLCRDVDNIDGSIDPDGPPIVDTAIPGSSKSTFKSTFTNLSGGTDNIVNIVMTNNVSKCIVTTVVQADTDAFPSIDTATFYWDGANLVTSVPLNTNLTSTDLELGPAPSGVSIAYRSVADGFGVDVSQPGATPISGIAYCTVESFNTPITA